MKCKLIALACMAWLGSEPANAALVCSNVTYGGYLTEVQAWSVGQAQKPKFASQLDVVVCSADGLELAYIRQRFEGLPITVQGAHAVVWRGDNAVFIIDNL